MTIRTLCNDMLLLGAITVPESYSSMPGVLIDIVMASLVFGVNFNKDKIGSYLDYVPVPIDQKAPSEQLIREVAERL